MVCITHGVFLFCVRKDPLMLSLYEHSALRVCGGNRLFYRFSSAALGTIFVVVIFSLIIFNANEQASIERRSARFSYIPCESLLIFFFQKPLEQRGIVACAVGDMVDIDRLSDQPIHADILSRNHIAVSSVSQFLVLRDMAGQRKHFQTGKRIQNQIGDVPC